jgi:hypothetical protein
VVHAERVTRRIEEEEMLNLCTLLRAVALVGAVVTAGVFAGAAQAETIIERHPIAETNLVCGGAVTHTITGTVVSIARIDTDGSHASGMNVFADYTTTFTNPTTGVSVTSVRGALERRVTGDDGGFTLMSAGLFGEFILRAPGWSPSTRVCCS